MRRIRIFSPLDTLKVASLFSSDVPSVVPLDPFFCYLSQHCLLRCCINLEHVFFCVPHRPLLPELVAVGIPVVVAGALFG